MAIIDKALQMAKAQGAITAPASTFSTHCIDLGAARGRSIVENRGFLQIRVGTAFLGGTSLEFQLIASDTPWTNVAGAGATNVAILSSTGAIATAALTANTIVSEAAMPITLPKRYLGIRVISLGTYTAGDFDANISEGGQVGPY